ncbi:hypothetical protein [Kitasatospora terrestris]
MPDTANVLGHSTSHPGAEHEDLVLGIWTEPPTEPQAVEPR